MNARVCGPSRSPLSRKRHLARVADDDAVEEVNAEHLTSDGESARDRVVLVAGRRITARVICPRLASGEPRT